MRKFITLIILVILFNCIYVYSCFSAVYTVDADVYGVTVKKIQVRKVGETGWTTIWEGDQYMDIASANSGEIPPGGSLGNINLDAGTYEIRFWVDTTFVIQASSDGWHTTQCNFGDPDVVLYKGNYYKYSGGTYDGCSSDVGNAASTKDIIAGDIDLDPGASLEGDFLIYQPPNTTFDILENGNVSIRLRFGTEGTIGINTSNSEAWNEAPDIDVLITPQ